MLRVSDSNVIQIHTSQMGATLCSSAKAISRIFLIVQVVTDKSMMMSLWFFFSIMVSADMY